MIGIYAIVRKDIDECYIGSAVSIAKRWREHRGALRRGKHRSAHMQNVWNKHGAAALEFVILETVADKARLIEREQVFLDKFQPAYNTAKVAGSCLGTKRSDEARAKISAANKGKMLTPEHRANLSAAMLGNTNCLGHKQTPEHRAAIGAGGRGKRRTPEQCANISAAKAGQKYGPQAPEHIAARVSALTGRPQTPKAIAARIAGKAAARAKRLAA